MREEIAIKRMKRSELGKEVSEVYKR